MTRRASKSRPIHRAILVLAIGGVGLHLGSQAWAWHHYRAAVQALNRREFGEARLRLTQCLRVWPTDGEALLLAARAAGRDGAASDAERLLAAAEKSNPEAVALEREVLRMRGGDLAGAERYFAACDAHRDKPETALILEGLIEGALKARQPDFADRCLKVWGASQANVWDRVQASAWRGELAVLAGEFDLAVVHLREAVESAPGNDAIRLRLSELLIRSEPAEARRHLEALRAKRPSGDRDVTIRLASCHRALGEHEEATRLLDGLLAGRSRDVPVLLERGLVALDLHRLDEAERWLRRAESVDPGRREVGLALARCLQLAGKDAEAQACRERMARADAEERAR